MKMCLEIFGSLEIALHRIENSDTRQRRTTRTIFDLKFFLVLQKIDNPKASFYFLFFFTRNVSTVTFMKGGYASPDPKLILK